MKFAQFFLLVSVLIIVPDCISCEENEANFMSQELVEQGRTFVHNTVKRLAIILPAIFFKLGIAFTMLLLVTIVAVNNGFIGFLLLIVGVSSVLARLQEAKRILPVPVPALHTPLPLALGHHHHFLDRSDDVSNVKEIRSNPTTNTPYSGYSAGATHANYAFSNNQNYAGSNLYGYSTQ